MKIEHKALGIDGELPELKTRHVEVYLREYNAADPKNVFDKALAMVRAAVKAGILVDFDVDEASPAAVMFVARKIDAAVAEALTIPPE
jgi:hypothetical protein